MGLTVLRRRIAVQLPVRRLGFRYRSDNAAAAGRVSNLKSCARLLPLELLDKKEPPPRPLSPLAVA
jgi:hypothetical protein